MLGIRRCGDAALLVELSGPDEVLATYAALAAATPSGVSDLVPAQCTILVSFEPTLIAAQAVVGWLRATPPEAPDAPAGRRVDIPVTYDGADLDDVARVAGVSSTDVVRLHREAEFRVAFCGFAPGFSYLTGLPPQLQLPRRATPRTRVPAGSVAIAGEFSAVYPGDSPGGWHLLGRAHTPMWDLGRQPPGLLQPGDAVRFVVAA